MLAVYSSGDAVRTVLVFLAWIAILGVGIWLLISLFRNRDLALWVKLGLVVIVVILPPLGLGMGIVVWVSTKSRSRAAEARTRDEGVSDPPSVAPAALSTTPAAKEAPYRLPFPPRHEPSNDP